MADQLHIKHYDSLDMFLFSFNPQVSQAPAGGASFPKIHERLSVVNFYFRALKADIIIDDFFPLAFIVLVLAPPGPPPYLADFSHLKHNQVNRIIFQVAGQHLLQLYICKI